MKTLRYLLILAISAVSFSAFAQLEVQIGAGGLFADINEVYDGTEPSNPFSGEAAFRPYFSGLIGGSFSQKWNVRGRVVGTSRAERNVGLSNGTFTYSAYYIDMGAELQWKPISVLGISVGPYYSIDLYERVKVGGTSTEPFAELYDNYVAVRPAIEVFFGPLVARLDTSFGLTPAQRLNYTNDNGQTQGEVTRFWNGASIGLSYRLIKA